MAIDINKLRNTYATNRAETLESAADFFSINLSEWTFEETSVEEKQGSGNDIVVIFNGTLTKEGEDTIYITELIDYHRLAYSYSYGRKIEEPIDEPEEGDDEE